jgi:general L-amino acid transport system permease protein
MWPIFLAGLYPAEERWRLVCAVLVLVAAILLSLPRLVPRMGLRWAIRAVGAVLFMLFVLGGVFGLLYVEPQRWGGLLLTVILAVVTQSIAFPLGMMLALGRRAPKSVLIQTASAIYIDVLRSVPLVMILLMTTLILPLFLPPSMPLNTVFTAMIGITLFSAASIAEVVRGGLAGLPAGQEEAAGSLGLTYWQTMRLVVLPQALHRVQPALVGTFILFVKGSSLVVAIGLYDLLGAAMLASTNPDWVGHTIDCLLFVAFLFWVICFSLSRYSHRLESRFGTSLGRNRQAFAPIANTIAAQEPS